MYRYMYFSLSLSLSLSLSFSCVFLPNNGAFFIAYIIVATLVATPLELLRLPQLLEYIYLRIKAGTKLERQYAFRKVYWPPIHVHVCAMPYS